MTGLRGWAAILLLHFIGIGPRGSKEAELVQLHIHSEGKTEGIDGFLRRVGDNLTLACTLDPPLDPDIPQLELNWYLPILSKNGGSRISKHRGFNLLQLHVFNLQETDAGNYICEGRGEKNLHLRENISLHVLPRKGYCGSRHFKCLSGECIFDRYICDGVNDCKDHIDEALHLCGKDPCLGKILCENGRCMDPTLCCDPLLEVNCTVRVRPSCCPPTSLHGHQMESEANEQTFRNDMAAFQTTVYTIIGCALGVLFIVTTLAIAVCRLHLKLSVAASSYFPPHNPRSPAHRWTPFPNPPPSVTYNINHGVQIMGPLTHPPPYSKVIGDVGPPPPYREGPPPPYASRENISALQQPLLLTTNNNGDINGNSTHSIRVRADSHSDV